MYAGLESGAENGNPGLTPEGRWHMVSRRDKVEIGNPGSSPACGRASVIPRTIARRRARGRVVRELEVAIVEAPEIIGVGNREEWDYFKERYKTFLDRVGDLIAALNAAFIRTGFTAEPVDRVIFLLGRLCSEDFWEIVLLCANGYGVGAQKILRGLYERSVTARYLHAHPEECDAFMEFYWIGQHRLGEAIRKTFGTDALPDEKFREVQANYQAVKSRFMVTDCKKCGTTRLNHTWSKLDVVSMAAEAGLGQLIVPGYYIPTRQAHSTMGAILSRLEQPAAGGIGFDPGPQRDDAHLALFTAHNLILNVLHLQKEHFHLDALEAPVNKCSADFLDIWKPSNR